MAVANTMWNMVRPLAMRPLWLMGRLHGFYLDCPKDADGIIQCQAPGSSHITREDTDVASVSVSFYDSTAIYLFGEVSGGLEYTTDRGSNETRSVGQPDGTLLAMYDNLKTEFDFSEDMTWDNRQHHVLNLNYARRRSEDTITITYAVHARSTDRVVISNRINGSELAYSPWPNDTTYWEVSKDPFNSARLTFEGNGILVYGLCTNTINSTTNLGTVSLDYVAMDQPALQPSNTTYMTHDCLLHAETQLEYGQHTLTWQADPDDQVLLSHYDSSGGPTSHITDSRGGGKAMGTGAIVGVAVGGAALAFLAAGWMMRRRQQRVRREDTARFKMRRLSKSTPLPLQPALAV
ncbi:hypothetical protein BKA62DRAFT_715905 [Auriculariales sp. MPI-PUGE-AT-0066]|nr:hypothetical protein BKA62DRAFT_715905 [Auriculariales sp. MPI-PUGE-AT-0066]